MRDGPPSIAKTNETLTALVLIIAGVCWLLPAIIWIYGRPALVPFLECLSVSALMSIIGPMFNTAWFIRRLLFPSEYD